VDRNDDGIIYVGSGGPRHKTWTDDEDSLTGFPAGTVHTIDYEAQTHTVKTPDGVICTCPLRHVSSGNRADDPRWRDAAAADAAAWERAKQDTARSRGGRTSGRKISEDATAREIKVDSAAYEYRQRHPYDRRSRSTRRMARDIANDLGIPAETVRSILRRLGIR